MKFHALRTQHAAHWLDGASRAPASHDFRQRGIMLMECIVYIGLLFVILNLAFMLFYRCRDFSIGLRRNADDVVRSLNVGERWREDVRLATERIEVETSGDGQVMHIPQKQGEVLYRLAGGELHRRAVADGAWVKLLSQVKSSHMQPDARARVTSWRWELELMQSRKNARVRPLFTFQAVPMNKPAP